MLAEALKFLSDAAREGQGAHVLLDDPRSTIFLVKGETLTVDKESPPRRHEAETLDEIVRLALRFREDEQSPVVWYDFDKITLVIDDSEHRVETATLKLRPTAVFSLICRLGANQNWFDQEGFVRLLRVDLAGTLSTGDLLRVVRYLKFENGTIVKSDVKHGRASYSADVVSKVESTVEIPEEASPDVRVWSNLGEDERYVVNCAVDVKPKEGKLQLVPLPDEIERVKNLAVVSIAQRLSDRLKDVPFYYGRP